MNDDEQLSDPPRLASDPGASDALRALAADARELAPPALPTEVRARVRARLARETARSAHVPWAWAAATLALAAVALLAWLWPRAATPTAPALPTLIAEPADAARDGGFDAGPLDPPEPRELVPFVEVSGNGCGLDVRVSLTEIDDDVRSVALVMDEHAADGDGSVSVDCEGSLVRELDGELFRAAERSRASLAVPFTLLPPVTRCGGRYSVTVCVRDALGRLATRPEATAYPTRTDDLEGRPIGRFETPSGRAALSDLARGHLVTGFFFQTSPPWTTPGGHWPTFVEASVLRVLREADVPAGVVALHLEDGHVVRVAQGQGVWVAESGYRPAEELAAGMRVLSLDGADAALLGTLAQSAPRAVVITEVRIEPEARLDGGLDVTFPDAFFLDGILVHDLGPDTRHTGPLATLTPSHEPVRALPSPSWDCSLATELVIDALPEDLRSIAIVYAPHRGRGGARMRLACEQGTVGTELPRALLSSLPTTRGQTRVLAAEISGWDDENDDWHPPAPGPHGEAPIRPAASDVRCSTEYAVLACVRGADGTLRSLEGASGRWALTGPACFARGTQIDTPEGPRPIESLRAGDRVLTRALSDGEVRPVSVRALLPRGQRPVLELVLGSGETLRVTAEHPLYDPQSESFRLAGSFVAGELLLSADGQRVSILEVRDRALGAPVYDLSVEAPHTYLAGGILAHNY